MVVNSHQWAQWVTCDSAQRSAASVRFASLPRSAWRSVTSRWCSAWCGRKRVGWWRRCSGAPANGFFTREQLENTPSRRCGVEPDRELSYRQQAANLIQDMGQRLNVYPSQNRGVARELAVSTLSLLIKRKMRCFNAVKLTQTAQVFHK